MEGLFERKRGNFYPIFLRKTTPETTFGKFKNRNNLILRLPSFFVFLITKRLRDFQDLLNDAKKETIEFKPFSPHQNLLPKKRGLFCRYHDYFKCLGLFQKPLGHKK